MFTTNKVIDKNKVQKAIEEKKLLNYESLKKEWDEFIPSALEYFSKNNAETENFDFNYYEYYVHHFSFIVWNHLSLDELEFIKDNNLFEFDKNKLLDCKCQVVLEETINNYKQTIADLTTSIQRENLGNYFGKFGDVSNMVKQGMKLSDILGLNRDDVELTELGIKLKTCIENLENLRKQTLQSSTETIKKHI